MLRDPPPLLLTQVLMSLVGCVSYLMLVLATWRWDQHDWDSMAIGIGMALATVGYLLAVLPAGRLADSLGRALTGAIGGSLGIIGAAISMVDEPRMMLVGTVLVFFATGVFFPAAAGLVSDAVQRHGAPAIPLHRKVSRYNLSWSSGNVLAFALAMLLASYSGTVEQGLLIVGIGYAVVLAVLLPWWRLPPRPPPAEGDRAPHPALPALTRAGRIGLLVMCLANFGLLGQCLSALRQGGHLGVDEARQLQSVVLFTFALGYVCAFVILGRWAGWIFRPWRLWLWHGFLLIGAGVLLAMAWGWGPSRGGMAAAGLLVGLGYGAAYTSSLFYSLRIPDRASRSASIHEAHLAVGNVCGPFIAGIALFIFASGGWVSELSGGLAGLALFIIGVGILTMLVQGLLFPSRAALAVHSTLGAGQAPNKP